MDKPFRSRERGPSERRPALSIGRPLRAAALLLAAVSAPSAAAALEPVRFGVNWLAQAEHGGFHQALADGLYAACGLAVEIVPGGPQVNNRALLLGGEIDFHMGSDLLEAFLAREEGAPVTVVSALFQKHPQAILAHPGAAETFGDLRGLTLLIGDYDVFGFYQWMIAAHGFTLEQRAVYTFNPAPFLADETVAMQAFVTAEPYEVERVGGFAPDVFLLADHGYDTYSTTIETLETTIERRPDTVDCFVSASAEGWRRYLHGDRSAADARIKASNPDMTDGQIAFSVDAMNRFGIVESGDAESLGIGAMTEERVRRFHADMVEAGVLDADADPMAAVDLRFLRGDAP